MRNERRRSRPASDAPAGNPKSAPVIGLVGGVASGKTFVAGLFARLGCELVDADRMAHQVLAKPEVRDRVRREFGDGVFAEDGRVDREALGERVFGDPARREALERIVHPPVLKRIQAALEAARARPDVPAVVLDAPLILEKGLDKLCDHVVYIQAENVVRQRRAAEARGWTPSELARRESTQLPLKSKRDRADIVIENDTTPESTLDQVRTTLSRIVSG